MLSPVEEIKSRLDIVDIIQEYVPLKPAGANLKGACPFHQEKTPSFMVHRGRQRWHCFGCNEGGDVFSFIQKIESIEFRDALELLARKANVELKDEDPRARSERARMKEVMAASVQWFRAQLSGGAGVAARAYLKEKRGLQDETIAAWQIGFAPDAWEGLTSTLRKRGFRDQEIIAAGVAVARRDSSGCYDRFRDRVMFPITDASGAVIGFTGRLLHEQPEAGGKYVNTPETLLYKKSAVLFGLDKAREDIRGQKYVLVVEGQMDVISLWQHEVRNVVASSGTAFTAEQLRLLKRYTDTLALCFDADAGGQAASLRSIEAAWAEGFRVQVVIIPRGAAKDPDELVRKDKEAFIRTLEGREPFLEYLYRRQFEMHNPQSVDGKKSIARELLGVFAKLADPIEIDHYLKRLSADLAVGEAALREALQRAGFMAMGRPQPRGSAQNTPVVSQRKPQEEVVAERIMGIVIMKPEVLKTVSGIIEDDEMPPPYDLLYKECILWYSKSTIRTSENLIGFIEASQPKAFSLIESLVVKRELSDIAANGTVFEEESLTLAKFLKRIMLKKRIDALSRSLKVLEQEGAGKDGQQERERNIAEISKQIGVVTRKLAVLDDEGPGYK